MCSVRFLDNVSAGTRGAISAEYFMKAGYGVIFVHHQFSLQPFSRRYSHSTNPFLNFWEIDAASLSSSTIDSAFPYSNDPLFTTPTPQITSVERRVSQEESKFFLLQQRLKWIKVLRILQPLVSEWKLEEFIVFKVVIANDLHHRKYRVVLTSPMAKADATKKLDGVVVSPPKYAEFRIEVDSRQPSNHPKEIDEDSIAELL
ncbi:hypothetical protein BDR06DRAFT_971198 [Suillus hirtellus]|nr:hypothetical protein BDR06DRAFT_971198 [Suillus hirtellus]